MKLLKIIMLLLMSLMLCSCEDTFISSNESSVALNTPDRGDVEEISNKLESDLLKTYGNINIIQAHVGMGKTMPSYDVEIVGITLYTKKVRQFIKNIETPGFIPYYSGYMNLKVLARLNNKISDKEIINSMNLVGLDSKLKLPVKKYSLGMRQRLGLAQAIMENPELLILDEPMNGLDKDGVADMRGYLLDLKKQGKTILLASHYGEDIEMLCDTVCEMDKGVLTRIK